MKYKIRDVIVFKNNKLVIIITNVDEKEQMYTCSFLGLNDVFPNNLLDDDDIVACGGMLIGNDLDFGTVRMLYL